MMTMQVTNSDRVEARSENERRALAILENAPDSFVSIDLQGRIIDWNAEAAKTFGWRKDEVIGRSLWDTIIHDRLQEQNDVKSYRYSLAVIIRNRRMELKARHRGGRIFPIEIAISAPTPDSSTLFFGVFIRDISARKKREEELRRARDEAEGRAKTLKILNGISRELSTLLNTDELFNTIGRLLFQLVEYSTFSIRLIDSTRQTLSNRFSLSGSLSLDKEHLPLSQGLVGVAARTGNPVVANDVKTNPHYIEVHGETRSECVVPLIVNNRLIGVLDIENSTADYFREHHVQALRILASQIAIALDNAMLYEKVSEQEQRLNCDLQFARRIQRLMLSHDTPAMRNASVATLSRPARIIAGDLFDFVQYKKRQMHACILGDVTGKGAPAGLYGALTSGMIRYLLEQELNPAPMLKQLNDALLERPIEAQFVALIFALWDDFNRTLYIANSGLPRPIHFSKDGINLINSVGTPLGLLKDREYEQTTVQGAPGDVFVFFTDGILEAHDADGVEFGYQRLEELLAEHGHKSAIAIRDSIAQAIRTHSAALQIVDDQTLIVLKVQASQPTSHNTVNLRLGTGELAIA